MLFLSTQGLRRTSRKRLHTAPDPSTTFKQRIIQNKFIFFTSEPRTIKKIINHIKNVLFYFSPLLKRRKEKKEKKHESKEQRKCSANRSNKDYSRAYTPRFLPSHLQVIRFLQNEHKIKNGAGHKGLCGHVRGAKTQKSSLSRTDPGLDSLSLSDHSNGSIAALQAPAAA